MSTPDLKCDALWLSEVNHQDDGAMTVRVAIPGTAALAGTHFRPQPTEFRVIVGSCIGPTPDDPRRFIELYSHGTKPAYRYFGEIRLDADGKVRARGNRVSLTTERGEFEILDDDEWVGTKST